MSLRCIGESSPDRLIAEFQVAHVNGPYGTGGCL